MAQIPSLACSAHTLFRPTTRARGNNACTPLPAALVSRGVSVLCWARGGQSLWYVYFEEERGRRSPAKLLTKDEASRIAANIAKLPQLACKR
jgi:hypothetical protein